MVGDLKAAPLEDVMAAMDVVDTLRHQQEFAARELDDDGRRARLKERLKKLYQAQGIEVPDHVLDEGISALEEERFQYQAVAPSWRTRVAKIWVSRTRWGKPLGFLTVLGGLFSGVYVTTDVLPERQRLSELPIKLEAVASEIVEVAKNPDVVQEARRQLNRAKAALQEERVEDAEKTLEEMQGVADVLQSSYTIRIVSRPGVRSGTERIPAQNPRARNYYLIVEAVNSNNEVQPLDILNEENNVRERVETWGLRVSEEIFSRVKADKEDDGIIQDNVVGRKPVGVLEPEFSVSTTRGTITRW